MKLLRLLLSLGVLSVSAWAQEKYEVRIARPIKEGARFQVNGRVAVEVESKVKAEGVPPIEERQMLALQLKGEMTVLGVTKKGTLKEVRVQVKEAESFADGEKASFLNAGDVITVRNVEDSPEDDIEVNGEEPSPELEELIGAAIIMSDDDQPTESEVLDPKDKVVMGEEWTPNRKVLLGELERLKIQGLTLDQIKGTATLEEKTTLGEQPALKVAFEVGIKGKDIRLPDPELPGKAKAFRTMMRGEYVVPTDLASEDMRGRYTQEVETVIDREAEPGDPSSKAEINFKRRIASDFTMTKKP